jgi:glycosyltransferase involved in cell wall biosynthesis
LAALPVEADMRILMRSYDALLHLPRHGNGTSVVISDALYCGKPVILSPLPDYRQAYGNMEGVLFADGPVAQLIERVHNWSEADFTRTSQAYRAGYDREDALRQWRRVVEE